MGWSAHRRRRELEAERLKKIAKAEAEDEQQVTDALESMTIAQMRAYASENDMLIPTSVTLRDDILEFIRLQQTQPE